MEKIEQLIAELLKANPQAMLTGSRALMAQGFKVRREPVDIDIWVPHGVAFNLIPGMIYPKTAAQVKAELAAEKPVDTQATAAASTAKTIDEMLDVLRAIVQNANSEKKIRIRGILQTYGASALPSLSIDAVAKAYADIVALDSITVKSTSSVATTGPEVMAMVNKATEEDYGETDYKIVRYMYEGRKVEVHYGRENEVRKPVKLMLGNASYYVDILKEKLAFVHQGSPTIQRHKDDVIFFLTANFI